MGKTATPWSPATAVERVVVAQRAGERRFSSIVELLETDSGDEYVRFAYATDGTARRGPVTFRARDLERLRRELSKAPRLAALLGLSAKEAMS